MSNEPPSEAAEVEDWLKNVGHFDKLRKKVLELLRSNKDIQAYLRAQFDESKTLRDADLENLNGTQKKKLVESLRRELEDGLLQKAEEVAWGIMTDDKGEMAKLIQSSVRQALCSIYRQKHKEVAELVQGQPSSRHPSMTPGSATTPGASWQQGQQQGIQGAPVPGGPGMGQGSQQQQHHGHHQHGGSYGGYGAGGYGGGPGGSMYGAGQGYPVGPGAGGGGYAG